MLRWPPESLRTACLADFAEAYLGYAESNGLLRPAKPTARFLAEMMRRFPDSI